MLRAARLVEHTPTRNEFRLLKGFPSSSCYEYQFTTWNQALLAAGLQLNSSHDHTNDYCTICGTNTSPTQWDYDSNHNLLCHTCYARIWVHNNHENRKVSMHKYASKRRKYGSTILNNSFKYSHGHHLWLENRSDFVVFIPNFLHKLHHHNSKIPESMTTPNALALDFWINESFYKILYEIK